MLILKKIENILKSLQSYDYFKILIDYKENKNENLKNKLLEIKKKLGDKLLKYIYIDAIEIENVFNIHLKFKK